jgi:methylamine dehydrogenase heavy chain
MAPLHLARVLAVQVSQDAAPILFAATTAADVAVFDALSGRLRHIEKHLGQTPWMLLNRTP